MNEQKTVGIVGGGQLGRMLTLAAKPLGFKVIVVDPTPNCPAAQVGAKQITANLYDKTALRKLAGLCDYMTVEIEHLDASLLAGIKHPSINPHPNTIELIQDKYAQKKFLGGKGLPVAEFCKIKSTQQAKDCLQKFGGKMILKSRHGAYDGRGNQVVTSARQLDKIFNPSAKGGPFYAEAIVPFTKELAVIAARDTSGKVAVYPVTKTLHQRNICIEAAAPASISKTAEAQAKEIALKALSHLGGAGVFCFEMFLTKDGKVLLNEIAPRVHNSGHYTMNVCATSQFEQHIRAITGLPLGNSNMNVPATVMTNILGERNGPTKLNGLDKALSVPQTFVHLYGKSPTKIDRKMGHINAIGDTIKQARTRAHKARKAIDI